MKQNQSHIEQQLVELVAAYPAHQWILDEYKSTEEHAKTAYKYILQHAKSRRHFSPDNIEIVTAPTMELNAHAALEGVGNPKIYINVGLRFFLAALNYSIAFILCKKAELGFRSINAITYTIKNSVWPEGVDLLSEMEAIGDLPTEWNRVVKDWTSSQIFFIVAHEVGHHLIWKNSNQPPATEFISLVDGQVIEVFTKSQIDEFEADRLAFEFWDELNSTVQSDFGKRTSQALGALFGYFQILEQYSLHELTPSKTHPPSHERLNKIKNYFEEKGQIDNVNAMINIWKIPMWFTDIAKNARNDSAGHAS